MKVIFKDDLNVVNAEYYEKVTQFPKTRKLFSDGRTYKIVNDNSKGSKYVTPEEKSYSAWKRFGKIFKLFKAIIQERSFTAAKVKDLAEVIRTGKRFVMEYQLDQKSK